MNKVKPLKLMTLKLGWESEPFYEGSHIGGQTLDDTFDATALQTQETKQAKNKGVCGCSAVCAIYEPALQICNNSTKRERIEGCDYLRHILGGEQ